MMEKVRGTNHQLHSYNSYSKKTQNISLGLLTLQKSSKPLEQGGK